MADMIAAEFACAAGCVSKGPRREYRTWLAASRDTPNVG